MLMVNTPNDNKSNLQFRENRVTLAAKWKVSPIWSDFSALKLTDVHHNPTCQLKMTQPAQLDAEGQGYLAYEYLASRIGRRVLKLVSEGCLNLALRQLPGSKLTTRRGRVRSVFLSHGFLYSRAPLRHDRALGIGIL